MQSNFSIIQLLIWIWIKNSMIMTVASDESSQMYFTTRLSNLDTEYDCLVTTFGSHTQDDDVSLQGYIQRLLFCIRPDDVKESRFSQPLIYYENESFYFKELYVQNITSDQLYMWSAPIDVIEQYQVYVETLDQSMSYLTYLNCTPPWFGTLCQYKLNKRIQSSSLISINGSCYTHLDCDRGPLPLCLQWFEICDGKINCANNGIDELYCDELETNECQSNEFRCHDGTQCIQWDLLDDVNTTPDCQDFSDVTNLDYHKAECVTTQSIFCTEYTCPRNQLSCSNGECVSDLNECRNYRGYLLMYNLLLSYNLSQLCKTAMSCATVDSSFPICNDFCSSDDNSCSEIISAECPSVFEFPSLRQIPAYTQFFYRNNHSNQVIPEFVCYRKHFFSPQPTTIQLNITTCESLREFEVLNISSIDEVAAEIENRYIMHSVGNTTHCLHTTLYHCRNSTKCISKHRLVDGVRDCLYGDDETYQKSCSLPGNYRFKCLSEDKCIMPWKKSDGHSDCSDGSDEPRMDLFYEPWKTTIYFPNLCDGINELLPILIDGKNESDETDCAAWPCNHSYTRCDTSWSCNNGADEVNCKSTSSCPPFHHACISPITYEMICLNISKADDGEVDCLGGSDERYICRRIEPWNHDNRFLCANESKCLDSINLCDGINDCYFGSDERFCNLASSHKKTIINFFITMIHHEQPRIPIFSLNRLYLLPIAVELNNQHQISESLQANVIQNSQYMDESKLRSLKTDNYWPKCNRGINLLVREQYNTSNYYHDICLCSQIYFGDLCQYQSQRVAVSIKIDAAMEPHTIFTIIILLVNQEHIINSYEKHEFIAIRDCDITLNSYLLYTNRSKMNGYNYSVRVDVYMNHDHLNYRTSWIFPLSFPFLPVHRVAVRLVIPPSDFMLQKLSHCERYCLHGSCTRYINNDDDFCRCQPGWSGAYCSIRHTCNCSPNAICVGLANNRSVCICPVDTYGSRCYLKRSSCAPNPCQNNGICISVDKYILKRGFTCICPEEFSGVHCEMRYIRLDITFSRDIPIPPFLYAYLISRVSGINLDMTTVFGKIAVFETSVSVSVPLGVQIVLANFNNQLYLTGVLPRIYSGINISSHITRSHRCYHIRELFNVTFVHLHLLQRLKRYHIPCQKQSGLMCFYDDAFMCLCNLDRHANCFRFQQEKVGRTKGHIYCENGGKYIYNKPIQAGCPTKSMCICSDCFHGGRCQFTTKGAGLSIDFILGYYVRPHISISHQPIIVKISIALTILLSVIGFVNAVVSVVVFQDKEVRKTGCGQYLLGCSLTSLLLVIIFLLRFWVLIFSQLSLLTNQTLLRIHCLSVDGTLNILLTMNNWFNAFVSIERTFSVSKGITFNKRFSRKIANFNIVLLILLTVATFVHDPVHRRIVEDQQEKRTWCIVQYSPIMQTFNSIITTCHFVIPFVINVVATFIIIQTVARKRSSAKQIPYIQQLHKQLHQSKHIIISPIALIILSLPHIVIKFLPGCMKSTRNPWLFLLGYFLPFVPPFMIFFVNVYPSVQYCRVLKKYFDDGLRRICF